MKLLLKGGRIIDPLRKIDKIADLLVDGGKVVRIETNIEDPGADIYDAGGMWIIPGLIDMHTHLREPGYEYKESIRTGCEAAVAGGFTAVACMPNTNPVNDTRSVTEYIIRQAALAGIARVYPVAAATRGSEGRVLSEFGDLKEAGAVAFSDDGKPVADSAVMRYAMEYAASFGALVISHCEDATLSADGLMNEGRISTELGLKGIPSIAEDIPVARDIAIAEYTGTSVHIAHVSTAGAVRIIREAKKRGVRVTAETAPHYFSLSDEALREFDTNLKMNPPLRSTEDVAALKEALRDGTIDVIATDHAPHSSIEKDVEFEYAANGIIGLETSLALSLNLVREGVLSPADLVRKMSSNPAAVLGVRGGTLGIGAEADITVIDPNRPWTVDVRIFRSKSRNSPFHGWKMEGKAVLTIVGGAIKYREG
ncbi:MAG TPA: dihydroorotase [Syntrophales bacterium]|nr:dihydroorotase [Syntrophales bacterium]